MIGLVPFFLLLSSFLPSLVNAGLYEPYTYLYFIQFTDSQCANVASVSFMAINVCYTQSLDFAHQATAADALSTFYPSTGWAKATFTQDSASTTGTLVLTQYTDSACVNAVAGSAITLQLPAASTAAPYGPYGTLSPCSSSFTSASGVQNIYNRGGTYSFTNKLELEAALSFLADLSTAPTPTPVGPVYATFADSYCSMADSADGAGNLLPTFVTWNANGACTYSVLTDKYTQQTCSGGSAVTGTNAYSSTWQGYADSKCTVALTQYGASGTGTETDANFCSTSTDPEFPYASNPIVGPYTGGYCFGVKGAPTKYLVLEQYYNDAACANGPSGVNAVILNQCVASETPGTYKLATFVPGITAFASGVQKDAVGTLTINTFTNAACTSPTGQQPYTFSVPTGPMGMPSTECKAGTGAYSSYSFKGGIYYFDDFSKLQDTIESNLGSGIILGTYADNQCSTINSGVTVGGGLPIMVTYLSNSAACVLNIATKTSLKSSCSGTTDSTAGKTAVTNFGGLTGTVTIYSDTVCSSSASPVNFDTGSYCWSTTATGAANIVPTIGPYTSGFCQLANEKKYSAPVGTIPSTGEAIEIGEIITGAGGDSAKARAAFIAAELSILPAGSTVSILKVTATGATAGSRRLGQGDREDRVLTDSSLLFKAAIANAAGKTAADLRTALNQGQSAFNTAISGANRLGGQITSAFTGLGRTLASAVLPFIAALSAIFKSCFAGSELVTLENGRMLAIADLQVGMKVLAVDSTTGRQVFSTVAYLPHGKNDQATLFTYIQTSSGRDVKMTCDHVLPAGACSAHTLPYKAAAAVAQGECVDTVNGREAVVSVSTVAGKGVYTAIPMVDLLVVNGIVATPFGGVNPTLANVYYNLHRLSYVLMEKAGISTVGALQYATEGVWAVLSALSMI